MDAATDTNDTHKFEPNEAGEANPASRNTYPSQSAGNCSKCGKRFTRAYNVKAHEAKCTGPKALSRKCTKCSLVFSRPASARKHEKSCQGIRTSTQKSATVQTCNQCDKSFSRIGSLKRHKNTCRGKKVTASTTPEAETPKAKTQPTTEDPLTIPPELQAQFEAEGTEDLYAENWSAIRSYDHRHRVQTMHNIRLTTSSIHDSLPELERIFNEQRTAFKSNGSFGLILLHKITGQVTYYHSSVNNARVNMQIKE